MQGKEAEFETLFLPHLDAAYNLARWLTGRDEDAEDIVQEAYLRALKSFHQFHGGNPRAWLFTIVRNTAFTRLRKRSADQKIVSFDEEIHVLPAESPPAETSHEEQRKILHAALGRLPAEFREVIVLFELEGWSYQTIAGVLEIPLGTVMSRLSRARRRLRKEIADAQSEANEDEM